MDPIIFLGEENIEGKRSASWLAVNPGGWSHYISGTLQGDAYLRLREQRGRVRVTEIYFLGPTAAGLRSLPLGRIEAAASGPGTIHMVRDQIAKRPSSYPKLPLKAIRKVAPRTITPKQPKAPTPPSKAVAYEAAFRAGFDGGAEILAGRPRPGKKATKQFYEEIAALFALYAARSRRPVKDIAALTGVSESTLHRWLSTARKLKVLAPGRRGTRK